MYEKLKDWQIDQNLRYASTLDTLQKLNNGINEILDMLQDQNELNKNLIARINKLEGEQK